MIELSPIDKIVLAGYLKRHPRLGFSLVGYRETVAAHSFSTAYIATNWRSWRGRTQEGTLGAPFGTIFMRL